MARRFAHVHPPPAASPRDTPPRADTRTSRTLAFSVAAASLALTLATLSLGLYLSGDHASIALDRARADAQALARGTAQRSLAPLAAADRDAQQAVLAHALQAGQAARIDLLDRAAQPLAGVRQGPQGDPVVERAQAADGPPASGQAAVMAIGAGHTPWSSLPAQLLVWEPVGGPGGPGWVRLVRDLAPLHREVDHLRRDSLAAALFAGLLGGLATFLLLRGPLRRITQMTAFAHGIAGNPERRLAFKSRIPVLDALRDALNASARAHAEQGRRLTESRAQAQSLLDEARQARDAGEQADAAKAAFLARVSHEIRTPLNGIVGMAELTRGTALSDEQAEYMGTLRESADALVGMIDDLLDFSRLEAGRLELESIEFALGELLADRVKAIAPLAHRKGVAVSMHLEPEADHRLIGDPQRIGQILDQLLRQALRRTAEGEIEIDAGVAHRIDDEIEITLSVRDTGEGLPADERARMFDPLNGTIGQAWSGAAGTGLGLALSSGLAQAMGGGITIRSSGSLGNLFRVNLLLQLAPEAGAPATADAGPSAVARALGGSVAPRVLVIDDRPGCQRGVATALRALGCVPVITADEVAALAMVRSQRPGTDGGFAACVLAARLQGVDAFPFAQALRDAGLGIAPIVMSLDTKDLDRQRERCTTHGVDAWVVEPLTAGDLAQAVLRACGRMAPHDEAPAPVTQAGRPALDILLAEDNPVNQLVATRILQKLGHRVRVVPEGQAAVRAVTESRPDLVLMDLQMPVMDGFAATQAIRANETAVREAGAASRNLRLPIVAMTAQTLPADRQAALAAGMDAYLAKPIDSTRLREILDQVCRLNTTPAWAGSNARAAPGDPLAPPGRAPMRPTGRAAPSEGASDARPTLAAVRHFDVARLHETLGEDLQLIERLAALFKVNSFEALSRLITALGDENGESAEFASHTLKGTLAMLGATEASALAQRIEAAVARREFALARELLEVFQDAMAHVAHVLDSSTVR